MSRNRPSKPDHTIPADDAPDRDGRTEGSVSVGRSAGRAAEPETGNDDDFPSGRRSSLTLPLVMLAGLVLGGLIFGPLASQFTRKPLSADEVSAVLNANPWILERAFASYRAHRLAQEVDAEIRTIDPGLFEKALSLQASQREGAVGGDISLVAFLDLNCGYCRQSIPVLNSLMEQDPSVTVIIRHLPALGEDSRNVARIAFAMDQIGLHRRFIDAVASREGRVDEEAAYQLALHLGAYRPDLLAALAVPTLDADLLFNIDLGREIGIATTPTFIINGHLIDGFPDPGRFRRIIESVRGGRALE